MTRFEYYGRIADADVADTHQNGRYMAQKDGEKYVPADVIKKLQLDDGDTMLDIGCGMGLTLLPVAAIAKFVDCCDHPKVIEKLKSRGLPTNVMAYGGDFLDVKFPRKYKKVNCYSVLPVMPDEKTLYAFVDKIIDLMEPDGMALLGDLANTDKRARFVTSKRGAAFQAEWEKRQAAANDEDKISKFVDPAEKVIVMGDQDVLKLAAHIRTRGYHAYIMNQPSNLPFGNTREDIVIVGPERESE